MNKQAVYHISDVPYAFAEAQNKLIVRLRTAKNDIKKCEIMFKDRYDWKGPFNSKIMNIEYSNSLFDFYEISLEDPQGRFRYYFKLISADGEEIYYQDLGLTKKLHVPVEKYCFQFPYINLYDVCEPVKWAQKSILYQIFPDRFYNGDKSNDPKDTISWGSRVTPRSFAGGDIEGIIQKIPYLKDLGINMLYLTPIFESSSNHKYNIKDYYKIDPHFGDEKKVKEFVSLCHKAGIRVIFDAVFNHTDPEFFAFSDIMKNGVKSKYKDWYCIKDFPVSIRKVNYLTFGNNITSMPKLNMSNPEVRDYFINVSKFYLDEFGIDGLRFDVADEIEHEFFKELRKAVKKDHPQAILIGEIMHEALAWTRGDQFDSFMNYPLHGLMIKFFAKGEISSEEFNDGVVNMLSDYTDNIERQLLNLIGSHDTPRFLTECDGDVQKMELAIVFQFTFIGIPYIYYGDEVGLKGENDPGCRGCMVWESDKQNSELLSLYKKLIKIRKKYDSLTFGKYECIYFKEQTLVFKRTLGKEIIYVLINRGGYNEVNAVELSGGFLNLLNENDLVSLNGKVKLEENEYKILLKINNK